jgi:PAS domain S-box-containing protein
MAAVEIDRRTRNDAFDQSPDLLAVVTFDGVFKVVNQSWSRTLGYRAEELVGHHLTHFLDDQDRAKALRLINPRLLDTDPGPFEIALRCKDRSYRAFNWGRRRVATEEAMFISGKDITQQKFLETTDNLRLYELMAAASRQKGPRAP